MTPATCTPRTGSNAPRVGAAEAFVAATRTYCVTLANMSFIEIAHADREVITHGRGLTSPAEGLSSVLTDLGDH